jgi:hypothetical protein
MQASAVGVRQSSNNAVCILLATNLGKVLQRRLVHLHVTSAENQLRVAVRMKCIQCFHGCFVKLFRVLFENDTNLAKQLLGRFAR